MGKSALGALLAPAMLALLLYGATLAPGLTWAHWGADGGDWATAALTGRVPHPPGAPAYLLLARLAAAFPWGEAAWRLNWLSALLASGAVGLTALAALRRGQSPWAAGLAAALLATTSLLWSQALITEVYSAATFFAALILALLADAAWVEHPWAVGLAWGLALAVHWTAVALGWLIVRQALQVRRRDVWAPLLGGVLLGGLLYAGLPLYGAWPQPWGDLRTWEGWWAFVSARLYWGYAFALPWRNWPQRLLAWGVLLTRQFSPVGALCAGVGVAQPTYRNEVVPLALVSFYAIGYATPDSLVYLTALLPLAALWLAAGLETLLRAAQWRRAALLLPLAMIVWQGPALSLHHDRTVALWTARVWAALPSDAVVVTMQDHHTFSLWYAQATGARPDVLVVDQDLWHQPAYRAFLEKQTGHPATIIAALAAGRPICRIENEGDVICP